MTKILIEIDPELQRVVPVEPTQEMIDAMPPVEEIGYWAMYESAIAAAPQPEPVDADLRRDADLWRAHQKRKQDLIDHGFLKSCLRSEESTISQGEQK